MHRILLELRDSQACALGGFLFTLFLMTFMRKEGLRASLRTTRDLVVACVILAVGTALMGWFIYFLAYIQKILPAETHPGFNWDLAFSFWTGGRGIYPIRSYPLAMGTAFAVAITLVYRRAPKEGLDPQVVANCAILVIVGTLVGGRALFVITQWSSYADNPLSVFYFWQGGLVFYGGAIGSFITVLIYRWFIQREALLPISDLMAPYAGLGLAIHRGGGCFMNGCCYGHPTQVPWGVHFPIDHHGVEIWGAEAYLHPTQLYESLNGLFHSRRAVVVPPLPQVLRAIDGAHVHDLRGQPLHYRVLPRRHAARRSRNLLDKPIYRPCRVLARRVHSDSWVHYQEEGLSSGGQPDARSDVRHLRRGVTATLADKPRPEIFPALALAPSKPRVAAFYRWTAAARAARRNPPERHRSARRATR
ncbi:MAG: prolipoprotein diacylglyceryl transferase [Deltaproteobacteria bacterium]|nr:prolipoprotein diacylglyceryl transferase [Deltaproteobacteria bacterium]